MDAYLWLKVSLKIAAFEQQITFYILAKVCATFSTKYKAVSTEKNIPKNDDFRVTIPNIQTMSTLSTSNIVLYHDKQLTKASECRRMDDALLERNMGEVWERRLGIIRKK